MKISSLCGISKTKIIEPGTEMKLPSIELGSFYFYDRSHTRLLQIKQLLVIDLLVITNLEDINSTNKF